MLFMVFPYNRSGRRNHFPFKGQNFVLCSGWHRLPRLRCLAISEFYPVRPILFSGTGTTLARISLFYAISVSPLPSTFGPTSIITLAARSFYLFDSTGWRCPLQYSPLNPVSRHPHDYYFWLIFFNRSEDERKPHYIPSLYLTTLHQMGHLSSEKPCVCVLP